MKIERPKYKIGDQILYTINKTAEGGIIKGIEVIENKYQYVTEVVSASGTARNIYVEEQQIVYYVGDAGRWHGAKDPVVEVLL